MSAAAIGAVSDPEDRPYCEAMLPEPPSAYQPKRRSRSAAPLTSEEVQNAAAAEGLSLVTAPSTKTGFKGDRLRRAPFTRRAAPNAGPAP